MHRRPVAPVIAPLARVRRNRRARGFRQQIDRSSAAYELDPSVEAPADAQAEGGAVELRRNLEVVDIDVY
jgi:hypothetical protein